MSVFDKLFGKLDQQKAQAEAQKASTLDDVYSCIARGVVSPPKDEKAIAADHAILENAIANGIITEERVKALIDQAILIKANCDDGETPAPELDFDKCQARIAAANAEIKAAREEISFAQQTQSMIQQCRQEAQRMILAAPEVGEPIAKAMKLSWNPRVCPATGRFLNEVQPDPAELAEFNEALAGATNSKK